MVGARRLAIEQCRKTVTTNVFEERVSTGEFVTVQADIASDTPPLAGRLRMNCAVEDHLKLFTAAYRFDAAAVVCKAPGKLKGIRTAKAIITPSTRGLNSYLSTLSSALTTCQRK